MIPLIAANVWPVYCRYSAMVAARKITRIYLLRDPRDGAVRYVGKTVARLEQRLAAHVSDARRGERDRKARWIATLLRIGGRPLIEEIEIVRAGEDWPQREAFWIAHFRRSADLCNHTDGGEGAPGIKRSRKSIEAGRRGLRISWTPERRAHAAELLAARNRTMVHTWDDERRAKVVARNKRMWTPERRAENAARIAARNKILKPEWTEERRARQAAVARRVNAKRWGAAQ